MDQHTFKHSYKNTLRENLSLTVYNTGFQKCAEGDSWGPAVRDHYLIHYVASGKGHFTCCDVRHHPGQGDLFCIFPGQIASYTADSQEPWEYFWVGFNGTEAKRLMELTGFSTENPVLHYKKDDRLKKRLLDIYRHRGSQPLNDCQMAGSLYLFLGELIQMSESAHPAATRHYGSYLERGMRFIQYNYADSISVEDIASYVGISRSHLYRIFIESTGLSPNEFLSKFRINEACSLLRKGELSVNQVASSVGYTDALYFSRVFRKIKGVSPSQYFAVCQNRQEDSNR